MRPAERLLFLAHASFAALTLALVTMTFAAAENYATRGHMLADTTLANGGGIEAFE